MKGRKRRLNGEQQKAIEERGTEDHGWNHTHWTCLWLGWAPKEGRVAAEVVVRGKVAWAAMVVWQSSEAVEGMVPEAEVGTWDQSSSMYGLGLC